MRYLGIDTSNYATSAAVFNDKTGRVEGAVKIFLEVKEGNLGLRQSDAVFLHAKNIPLAFEELARKTDIKLIDAIGVSTKPRDIQGSYMPCFLSGAAVAYAVSQTSGIPIYQFSHQAGHVMAALYGTGFTEKNYKEFLAFHVSGGTTDAMVCTLDGANLKIEQVATSLDLFAGQAVDRVGHMLGLSFPAGEKLSELAWQCDTEDCAQPVLKGGDCCLSGLENQCKKLFGTGVQKTYIARYCLNSISAVINSMAQELLRQYGPKDIIFAGGVMSSDVIRKSLKEQISSAVFCKHAWLSADNAAGVAMLAARKNISLD